MSPDQLATTQSAQPHRNRKDIPANSKPDLEIIMYCFVNVSRNCLDYAGTCPVMILKWPLHKTLAEALMEALVEALGKYNNQTHSRCPSNFAYTQPCLGLYPASDSHHSLQAPARHAMTRHPPPNAPFKTCDLKQHSGSELPIARSISIGV